MYDEDDLLPLSALQHLLFCERQCALIHLEGVWQDNRLTVQGSQLHERVHQAGDETRGDVRIARGVRLRSLRLGLSGKADVVEFHRLPETGPAADADSPGAVLPGLPGRWRPFPVEYKRGRPKRNLCDKVQLCAQALCLEEMLDVHLAGGTLFYGATRKRQPVDFDHHLRRETEGAAHRLHQLIADGTTPTPTFDKKCRRCSLLSLCLPEVAGRGSAERYLWRTLARMDRSPSKECAT